MDIGVQSSNDMLFMNFNQDFTCLSVGTRQGYRIYNSEPFGKYYSKSDGGIGMVEMLFSTNLVALVGSGEQPTHSPRKLQIINIKRQSTVCELTFVSAVLAVKLNRKRLIVVLEEHIYLYDIRNMKLLHTIDTFPNPNGLIAFSPSSENCYLAYPPNTSGLSGEVLLFDANNLQAITIIQAHKSPLSCIAFNHIGTMLATASDKGTIIRVFSVPSGQKLYQFRRGTYPAKIHNIAFNLENTLLAVSSDTDTVHLFKLMTPEERANEVNQAQANADKKKTMFDVLKQPLASATASLSNYIVPDKLSEMWEPQRDFAHAKIPSMPSSSSMPANNNHHQQTASSSAGHSTQVSGTTLTSSHTTYKNPLQTICGLTTSSMKQGQILMVATSDGYFYQYGIDEIQGGNCTLMKQFSLSE